MPDEEPKVLTPGIAKLWKVKRRVLDLLDHQLCPGVRYQVLRQQLCENDSSQERTVPKIVVAAGTLQEQFCDIGLHMFAILEQFFAFWE